jgi:phosphoglycolate phosphatase-like HAD superfamily hydrolase
MASRESVPTTCVIFDIDGTLVDSGGFEETLYTTAIRDVLGDVRFRADWAAYRHVSDAGLLREICQDNALEIRGARLLVRARFGDLVSAHLRATGSCTSTPGALSLWNRLRDSTDVALGIATGGWGHTARMKLESAGFVYADVPLASSDDSHIRIDIMKHCRSQLSPTDWTIYVGDGEWDQVAAERLGWRFIGVGNRLRGKCSNWIADFASGDLTAQILAQANMPSAQSPRDHE